VVDVKRSLHVDADPTRVIEYISDVSNHPAFIPPLKDVSNVTGDPKHAGTRWDWTFTMAGVQLKGHAERRRWITSWRRASPFEPPVSTALSSTRSSPMAEGSRLTATVSYEVPEGVLAKVADRAVVARINEGEADHAGQEPPDDLQRLSG